MALSNTIQTQENSGLVNVTPSLNVSIEIMGRRIRLVKVGVGSAESANLVVAHNGYFIWQRALVACMADHSGYKMYTYVLAML